MSMDGGQIFAPAISALPPSVVVVLGRRICTGRTVVGQCICTGRTVVGQCRSYCRGAVVEEQLPRDIRALRYYQSFKIPRRIAVKTHSNTLYSRHPALQITSCNLPSWLAIAIQFCSLQN